jgi:hypothetical protein
LEVTYWRILLGTLIINNNVMKICSRIEWNPWIGALQKSNCCIFSWRN